MIIKNATVYTDTCKFAEKDIYIEGSRIAEQTSDPTVLDAEGCYLIPGLIDIHFHGCRGYDFCDATPKSLAAIAEYELSCGITSICPATMTLPEETLAAVCRNAALYSDRWQPKTGARLCGIHLEGPFISAAKKGAQNPDYILSPDAAVLKHLIDDAKGLIKLITIAPEAEHAIDFILEFAPRIRISLGHTNCSYNTAKEAFLAGARHVTHLYNAMPPFSHRSPGLIGAAFDTADVTPEIICDGIHIDPSAVRAAFALFGDRRILLISDSIMATGMPNGSYSLGGLSVHMENKRATLADGTIAGSAATLMDCMKTAVLQMGIPLESAIRCATINPARAIGEDREYGSITTGKYADLLLLERDTLNLKKVITHGIVL